MKRLIPLLLLCFSFSAAAEPPPPATAFRGVLYGYDVAIYMKEIFSGQYGLRTIYKTDGEWLYLTEPDFYASQVNSKELADAIFTSMIEQINTAAYEELNDISLEPMSGVERIKWLLENKITIVDNQIVIG